MVRFRLGIRQNLTITDVGFSVHEFVFQGTKLYAPAEALMRR